MCQVWQYISVIHPKKYTTIQFSNIQKILKGIFFYQHLKMYFLSECIHIQCIFFCFPRVQHWPAQCMQWVNLSAHMAPNTIGKQPHMDGHGSEWLACNNTFLLHQLWLSWQNHQLQSQMGGPIFLKKLKVYIYILFYSNILTSWCPYGTPRYFLHNKLHDQACYYSILQILMKYVGKNPQCISIHRESIDPKHGFVIWSCAWSSKVIHFPL